MSIEDLKKEFKGFKKDELLQKILEERECHEKASGNLTKIISQLRDSNRQLTEELSGKADVRLEYERLQDSIIGDLVSDMISSTLQDIDWDEMIGRVVQKHLQVDVSKTEDGHDVEISWK